MAGVIAFAATLFGTVPPASANAECTAPLVSTTSENIDVFAVTHAITKAREELGADVYVRIYDESPAIKGSFFDGIGGEPLWWKEMYSTCDNWRQPDPLRKDEYVMDPNLVVLVIGTDTSTVSIGYGDDFREYAELINDLALTKVKPLVKEGKLTAAVELALQKFPRNDENDTYFPVGGIVALAFLGALVVVLGITYARLTYKDAYSARRPPTVTYTPPPAPFDGTSRIAAVREALSHLESDWLSYEMDLEAYYLTKPLLRDMNDPVIHEYHHLMSELRDTEASLGRNSREQDVVRAEKLVDKTLSAWNAADLHAIKEGTGTLSAVERAALRKMHAMISQLMSSGTPEAMYDVLVSAIRKESAKLVRTAVSWAAVANIPALKEHAKIQQLLPKS